MRTDPSTRQTSRRRRASWSMLVVAAMVGGCASLSGGPPPPVEPAGLLAQLAVACRPSKPTASGSALAKEPPGAVATSQDAATALAVAACAPADPPAGAAGAASSAVAALATGSLGESLGRARGPAPVVLRYEPNRDGLRRGDATLLAAAIARGVEQGGLRLTIAVGRGGLGNAFEQVVRAQNRALRLKEMLPPGMVSSITFDPGLPDDTARLELVPVDEREADG